jgi:peptidoglycan hydrolase-like protein with peptidoglycan-binding domain
MNIGRAHLILAIVFCCMGPTASAQDAQQAIGPFFDLMGKVIDEAARQQALERMRNSPEYINQQPQPGGLTRGQVTIVQQLLLQRGYDVGEADGIVGPKTMAVVAKLQAQAGLPVDGYPTQQLLDALVKGP